MKNYDALIFDMDGTLWDAREQVTKGWNLAYEAYTGKPGWLTMENFACHFGATLYDLVRIAFPGVAEEEIDGINNLCQASQTKVLRQEPGVLYPGVLELIPKLAEHYDLYIVSNCAHNYIDCLAEGYDLRRYFKGWMCFEDTYQPKDVNLRLLCEKYGLQKPVYVGDTQGDADACEKAGVPMIFASYGLGKVASPMAQIDAFADLLEVLDVQ